MMRRCLLFCALLGIFSGCQPRYDDFFYCHDDGRAKPRIAIFPVKDSSTHRLPWNVGEELTAGTHATSCAVGNLYLISADNVSRVSEQLQNVDLMSQDLDYFRQFHGCDFIVVAELVDHSETALAPGEELPLYLANAYVGRDEAVRLNMKMLVKVIDVRLPTPTLLLQEVVRSQYVIPTGKKAVNYAMYKWGSPDYETTPLKQAHLCMIRDLRTRLEAVTYAAIR
jgi:hypothetical protein